MPRKPKVKTRRITINVALEVTFPEDQIPAILQEMPAMFDDLRGEDSRGQILSLWATVHDCQDVVGEYQYLRSEGVREARIADPEYLTSLGYKHSP